MKPPRNQTSIGWRWEKCETNGAFAQSHIRVKQISVQMVNIIKKENENK